MFFSKYSASGNDFILTYTFRHKEYGWSDVARKVCRRQDGIGADGFIVLKPHCNYAFEWEFYNADGSSATMCGNGSRAAAMYAYDLHLAGKTQEFLTKAGVICTEISSDFVESALTQVKVLQKGIYVFNRSWWLLDTGVPHLVCETLDFSLNREDLRILRHQYNANVNLAKLEKHYVSVRTFERGVEDETLACGTGMAAVFYYLRAMQKVPNPCCFKSISKEELFLREHQGRFYLKGQVRKIFDFIL